MMLKSWAGKRQTHKTKEDQTASSGYSCLEEMMKETGKVQSLVSKSLNPESEIRNKWCQEHTNWEN